jgi:hypothetical protein
VAGANGPKHDVLDWDAVDWRRVEGDVRRLWQRIFTASRNEPGTSARSTSPEEALTSTAAQGHHAKGTHPLRVGKDGGSPASASRSAGAAHHLPLLDVGG